LTIRNVPALVVKRLKQKAAAQHRSLNFQVIFCLEQMTHSVPVDADALLVRARALRRMPKGAKMTDRLLRVAAGGSGGDRRRSRGRSSKHFLP
jgi:plasmid stability protein